MLISPSFTFLLPIPFIYNLSASHNRAKLLA
jgi:hypothetical protein